MTILVVITISNVACSCSHYNFDMPDNLTSPAGLSSFTSLVLSLTRSGYLLSKMTVMSGAVTEKIAPPPSSPPSSSWIDDLGFFSQVKLWTGSHNECCPRWQLQIFPAQWMTGWEWPTTLIIHKQDNCLPVRRFLHSQTLPQADLIFGTLEQSYWYILYTICIPSLPWNILVTYIA